MNARQAKQIERWLEESGNYQKDHCPFYPNTGCDFYGTAKRENTLCAQWFVRTRQDEGCPCYVYTLSYVIRTAKKKLKEYYEEGEK